MDKNSLIYVAGHRGMVGSAVCRKLRALGYERLLVADRHELDLTRQDRVQRFLSDHRPEYVFLCAARVGGIHANSAYPADFIHDNLAIQTNVIDAAWRSGTKKLIFLGSSCIYPRDCPQPIREEYLLSGPLESTNQAYAIAKISGVEMCRAYRRQHGFDAICAMPTNLYGPGDNYHPDNSHVIAALVRKFVDAKRRNSEIVWVWGDGSPKREFLHVDDLASALVSLIINKQAHEIVNIGSGTEVSIRQLAKMIADIVGYDGIIRFDTSKPNGTPRKLLDSSRIASLGWKPSISLESGIREVSEDFMRNPPSID